MTLTDYVKERIGLIESRTGQPITFEVGDWEIQAAAEAIIAAVENHCIEVFKKQHINEQIRKLKK
jgi:hypothetical protein